MKNRPILRRREAGREGGATAGRELPEHPAMQRQPATQEEGPDQLYKTDPPAADGSKIVISDTDHLWGVGGDRTWVWKSFLRGLHPIFMDRYRETPSNPEPTLQQEYDGARDAMGDTLRYAERVDLAAMTPHKAVSSTGYCLANPGVEYLAFQPEAGEFTLDLPEGTYAVEWFNPTVREETAGDPISADGVTTMIPPFDGQAVVYLEAANP